MAFLVTFFNVHLLHIYIIQKLLNYSQFQEKSTASRLAKISLFRRFLKLATSKKLIPITVPFKSESKNNQNLFEFWRNQKMDMSTYSEAKKSAEHFQKAKDGLFSAFLKVKSMP